MIKVRFQQDLPHRTGLHVRRLTCCIGVMSGVIGADSNFGQVFNHPNAAMQGNITALYYIGCVVGSIACYFIGEKFGRRTMLMAGGLIMAIGTGTSWLILHRGPVDHWSHHHRHRQRDEFFNGPVVSERMFASLDSRSAVDSGGHCNHSRRGHRLLVSRILTLRPY